MVLSPPVNAPPMAPPFTAPPISVPPVTIPPTIAPPALVGGPADLGDSMSRTSNDSCIKRMQELQLEQGKKTYIQPTSPGTTGKNVQLQTNVFGVELEKHVVVHHYMIHVKADISVNKEAVFTKKAKEDFVVLDRREKCCIIFFHAVSQNTDFFKMHLGNRLIYDGQSQLFTTEALDFDGEVKAKILEVNGASTGNPDLQGLPVIHLEVSASKIGALPISAEILGKRTADCNIEANNRVYTQFLELAINQRAVQETSRYGCFEHGKVYFLTPLDDGFDKRDCVDVGDGKGLLPGLKKTVQFIEGPYGRGQNNPSVVIDAMKAAFHKEQPVINKIFEILQKDPSLGLGEIDKERAYQVMRGLDVFSTYTGRTRHLKLEGIHKESAVTAKFELPDGKSQSVLEYFAEKYKITLKYPNANLLICKERGNKNFFPSELMTISKNQRVSIPQQTSAQSQKTTKECAVLPDIRQRLIVTGKEALRINEANPLLQELGVKVYAAPLMVKGRELEGRDVEYSKSTKSELGKWRPPMGHYVKAATMPTVWATYCVGAHAARFSQQDLSTFIQYFMETCQKKGMKIGAPAEIKTVGIEEIDAVLNFALKCKCKFVFLITDDSITHLHARIKYLERNTSMIIQDMKLSKAASVVKMGKRLTLENVINKTNVKLGGLNYLVVDAKKCLTEDQLIIGVGLSAPPPGSKFLMEGKGFLNPRIVGFASNAISAHEFTGDFILAQSNQESLASIEDVLRRSVELYKEKRKDLPKRVVVYRSGVSEGSHGAILAYEIPLTRGVLAEICGGVKLIYIVVSKDHGNRFFNEHIAAGSKPTEMNIPAGIVVDGGVTNPACKQFFLNSHTTLQGSAKTPLYTVLHDDLEAPMERLEELTYTLCHHHQIVALTTSLPTPLYVANEYAKRGRALWNEKTNNTPEVVEGANAERIRLAEITEELAYKNTDELRDKRVNA